MTPSSLPMAVDSSLTFEEGTIPFVIGTESYKTWYKVFGKLVGATQPPLIVLHGGPGITHDYMLPLSDLAKAGDRAVIFYDQLGNGRSTHLPHKTEEFWTIDLFIDELVNLIQHFQLELFDIAGHSWGCTLGLEYLIRRQPAGARRFLALNGPASIPLYMEAFARNLKSFSKEVQEGIAMQKTDFARFRAAQDEYDAKHTCAVVPFPREFVYSMESHWAPTGGDDTVSRLMFDHKLQDWSAIGRLHLVTVPVFVINGAADTADTHAVAPLFFELPRVRWVTMDGSSHMPFWEERARFDELVDQWLRE